jgi:hypothetical protein
MDALDIHEELVQNMHIYLKNSRRVLAVMYWRHTYIQENDKILNLKCWDSSAIKKKKRQLRA